MNQSGNNKFNEFGFIDNIEKEDGEHIDIHEYHENPSTFDPSQFFIPGWKGEGLLTQHGLQIKYVLNNLTIDATSIFKKLCSSTVSMKKQTFDEFLAYLKWSGQDTSPFTHPNDFWVHLQDEYSPFQNSIQEFIRLFCFRAVAIYLFRIKFILDLSRELKLEINEDTLLNPLSFLSRIFRKNSSTELNCESLQINQYSWYRPTPEYKESLVKVQDSLSNVTLTELIKLLSTPKEYKIYSLKNYSHSLSHINFGQFINDLIIQFPKWLNSEDKIEYSHFYNQKSCIIPNTISTLFEGNHVSSMALSHWLAQESNVANSEWDNIICPHFKGTDFIDGSFIKICQELQFLSFLTKAGSEHGHEIVPFICKIMKDKNKSSAEDSFDQISLLELTEENNQSIKHNRVILNLLESPKTNPHHHLVTQIINRKDSLKRDGTMFVLTNQKLFVPSHSERVELLLKDFKVNAIFVLDELKGKGELPQYIYVLTKRNIKTAINPHLFKVNRAEKESCLTFHFKGNLARFNKFKLIINEFDSFIKTKKIHSTPIFVSDIDSELSFEFHSDAIVEGKLVSSTQNKENGQHTHPSFFKNLIKTCVSLDTFFHMDSLNPFELQSSSKSVANELLGVKSQSLIQYSLLLIVNQTNPLKIELDLVPFESFKAKVEEHGTAYFSYFGLTPKHSAINLNAFREYFNSTVGFQIIQMQLSDGQSKLKGKLKSLLVPAFLAKTQFMPQEMQKQFNLLEKDPIELFKMHPDELNYYFKLIENKFAESKEQYPWHLLSLFSHFKLSLKNRLTSIEEDKADKIQFANPLIAEELVKLKTYSIYPKNNDIFVDIITKSPSDLHLTISNVSIKNDEGTSTLIITSGERNVVAIYSADNMVQFLKYILQNAIGYKIADVLRFLKAPTIAELDQVISQFSIVKDNKINLIKKTDQIIAQIFREQISF